MHFVLLAIGALMAAAGAMIIRSSLPIEDVSGGAWLTAGFVVLVGGAIVAAVAAAVRSLGRIAERLDIQPLPLPPIASVGREDPAPRAVRPPAPAAGPSLLGWLGRAAPPVPAAAARSEPPPVDLGPLAQIPEPPRAPPPPPVPAPRALPRSAPAPAAAPQAPPPAAPGPTVYRSGVIDGMAYTLFTDGSIAAELPQGRIKFASVDELQKYLTEKGA